MISVIPALSKNNRHFFHSIVILGILAILFLWLMIGNQSMLTYLSLGFILGYLSHLLLDATSRRRLPTYQLNQRPFTVPLGEVPLLSSELTFNVWRRTPREKRVNANRCAITNVNTYSTNRSTQFSECGLVAQSYSWLPFSS